MRDEFIRLARRRSLLHALQSPRGHPECQVTRWKDVSTSQGEHQVNLGAPAPKAPKRGDGFDGSFVVEIGQSVHIEFAAHDRLGETLGIFDLAHRHARLSQGWVAKAEQSFRGGISQQRFDPAENGSGGLRRDLLAHDGGQQGGKARRSGSRFG